MSERILVCVAWPYANGSIHVGQLAGAYLPPDIFARYQRLKGNEVLMVSGSDAHGTPITLAAEQKDKSPEVLAQSYQAEFLACWDRLGICYDLFTSTHTDNHSKVSQDVFARLNDKGYIFEQTTLQPFCVTDRRYLADRYVGGACPHCSAEGARGDQCDTCGRTLDPQELLNWTCLICGNPPDLRETTHLFFRLSTFEASLLEWIRPQDHWRANARNFSIGFLENGLKDRPVTRDIDWGVEVPFEGYENKRIYVWFEAVIGYLSASIEWAKLNGDETAWEPFWKDDACKSYYFMGKDNIPFHSIIWPAMLKGYGGLNLPYNIVSSEYLNIEGAKASTSKNWAVWLPDLLDRYDPDAIRYVLTASGPETSDTDFSWEDFVRKNNDELVATYGNLLHRIMTMAYKNFNGAVPEPGEIDEAGKKLLETAQTAQDEVAHNLEQCRFRAALSAAMRLAQSVNQYVDFKAPWQAMKTDKNDAATSLWVCLSVMNCLKIILWPVLPFSSEKLHSSLGFSGSVRDHGWQWNPKDLQPGQCLEKPEIIFTKLDLDLIEEEVSRLGA